MNRAALKTMALMAVTLCAARPAHAQDTAVVSRIPAVRTSADSVLEARTAAVAATLRCPVCQGESIQDSPADLAQQMREVVRERLRAGETPDQIKAYFVSKYGEWILLEPTSSGLNVLLYVLPVLLVIGGLAFVVVLVRRWTTPAVNTE